MLTLTGAALHSSFCALRSYPTHTYNDEMLRPYQHHCAFHSHAVSFLKDLFKDNINRKALIVSLLVTNVAMFADGAQLLPAWPPFLCQNISVSMPKKFLPGMLSLKSPCRAVFKPWLPSTWEAGFHVEACQYQVRVSGFGSLQQRPSVLTKDLATYKSIAVKNVNIFFLFSSYAIF